MDARRTSARTLKRKAAWGPHLGCALAEQAEQSVQREQLQAQRQRRQQQQQVSSPLSRNGQPCGRAPPQMLSPPDMVWPANTLAQVLNMAVSHACEDDAGQEASEFHQLCTTSSSACQLHSHPVDILCLEQWT